MTLFTGEQCMAGDSRRVPTRVPAPQSTQGGHDARSAASTPHAGFRCGPSQAAMVRDSLLAGDRAQRHGTYGIRRPRTVLGEYRPARVSVWVCEQCGAGAYRPLNPEEPVLCGDCLRDMNMGGSAASERSSSR